MRANGVKRALREGGYAIGSMVFEFDTPGIAGIMDSGNVDFVVYDMEHSGFGIESVKRLMSYHRGRRSLPIVRVPDTQYHFMAGALDAGASGIMVPMVESAAQARAIVDAAKYGPLGKRGIALRVAHDDYADGDPVGKFAEANEETMIVVQIETRAGVERIDEIAAVDGIDVAWVGHYDLSQSLGIPGQTSHPALVAAMDRVAEACAKRGIAAGRMAPDAATVREWAQRGYRCFAYSGDIWLLQQALAQGISDIRKELER